MAYIIACSAEDLPYMTTKSGGQYLQWLHAYSTVHHNNNTTTTNININICDEDDMLKKSLNST